MDRGWEEDMQPEDTQAQSRGPTPVTAGPEETAWLPPIRAWGRDRSRGADATVQKPVTVEQESADPL